MTDLVGDVVIVTGAATGLGRGLALEAARRGARVVVSDVADGQSVVDDIVAAGGQACFVRADVSDYASMESLVTATVAMFGGVNVLVNNAIRGDGAAPLDLADPAGTKDLIDTGVTGVIYGIRAAAEQLKAAASRGERASIVNVGSEHSLGVPPHVQSISTYTVAKYAVLGITDTARRDFADAGVHVMLLAPGWVRTEKVLAAVSSSYEFAMAVEPYAQSLTPVTDAAWDGVLERRYIVATNPASREFALDHARRVMAEVQRLPAPPEPTLHAHDGSGDIAKCPVAHILN